VPVERPGVVDGVLLRRVKDAEQLQPADRTGAFLVGPAVDKAVELAITAKEVGFPKETDGKRVVREWRASRKSLA